MVGGSSYREAGVIPVKATRPSAAQVANPCSGLSGGIIGGVDIYQGVVGDVGGSWYGGRWHDDVVAVDVEKRLVGSGICVSSVRATVTPSTDRSQGYGTGRFCSCPRRAQRHPPGGGPASTANLHHLTFTLVRASVSYGSEGPTAGALTRGRRGRIRHMGGGRSRRDAQARHGGPPGPKHWWDQSPTEPGRPNPVGRIEIGSGRIARIAACQLLGWMGRHRQRHRRRWAERFLRWGGAACEGSWPEQAV